MCWRLLVCAWLGELILDSGDRLSLPGAVPAAAGGVVADEGRCGRLVSRGRGCARSW